MVAKLPVLALTVLAFVARAEEPPAPRVDSAIADELETIAAELRELEEDHGFSGAVGIVKDGDVVFEQAYGDADRAAGIPNRVDTQFNLASIGKTFTGVAVSQLAEKGLVDLDAPVGRYVPGLPEAIAERVTIEHLLTHTAGLHNFFGDARYARLEPRLTDVAAYRPLIESDRPAFPPGRRFMYSNSGYVVLGMVIEEVTGRDYYDYVQEHVFDVAGMDDTGFYGPRDRSPGRAVGYTRRRGKIVENTSTLPPRGSPAGGVYSTVDDLFAFSDALWSHRLLSPSFTRRATTSKIDDPGGGYGYGFGIRAGYAGDSPSIGHNGGAPGIAAEFTMNPGLGYTVVVLGNVDSPAVGRAIDVILNELRLP